MVDPNAIAALKQGEEAWAAWRTTCTGSPDLSGTDLTHLNHPRIVRSDFCRFDFHDVDFTRSNLSEAILHGANLKNARLQGADLFHADLSMANFADADLSGSNLVDANLRQTNLAGADLTGASVYGVSAWDILTDENTKQKNLKIIYHTTEKPAKDGDPPNEASISVDYIQVAQFIWLLVTNKNIRHVIDTVTTKVVLILGRFTPERKAILESIRDELRRRDYVPVLFDFEPSKHQTITQTVSTLAHMARFIIADITDPSSIPQELTAVVPNLPTVPVQPILLESARPWSMFRDLMMHPSMLDIFRYRDAGHLIECLQSHVVGPAEARADQQFARWQQIKSAFP